MMTREKMLELQQTPKRMRRFYQLSRPGAVQVALSVGRLFVAGGGDPKTGWWKELARLTREEVRDVRDKLAAEDAA